MLYDWETAIELAKMFFQHGISRPDARNMIERFAFHKYPFCEKARQEFSERAIRYYARELECNYAEFGKSHTETTKIFPLT